MDQNNNISFIIPAYNCQDTLAETIDSIFNNNFTNGDEVIVPDATRLKLIKAFKMLENKVVNLPKRKHSNIPL